MKSRVPVGDKCPDKGLLTYPSARAAPAADNRRQDDPYEPARHAKHPYRSRTAAAKHPRASRAEQSKAKQSMADYYLAAEERASAARRAGLQAKKDEQPHNTARSYLAKQREWKVSYL